MLSPLVASDDDDDAFGRGVVGGELGLVTERRVLPGGCTRSWRGVNERVRLTPEAWPSDCIRSRTLTGRAGDVLVSFTTSVTVAAFVAVAGFGGDFFVGDGDLRSLAHARSVASCSSMLRIRSVKGKGLVTESGEARAELLVEASEEVSGLLPSASIGKGVGMSAAPTLISKRHGTSGSAFGPRHALGPSVVLPRPHTQRRQTGQTVRPLATHRTRAASRAAAMFELRDVQP